VRPPAQAACHKQSATAPHAFTTKMAARALQLVALAMGHSLVRGATPISKVIQLLNEMHVKGVAMKNEESTKFSAFTQWCADQKRSKTQEIQLAGERMDLLNAEIQKAGVQIQKYTDRVHELDEDIGRWKKDTHSATDVRSKEKTDFQATVADYSESIDALTGAITVLKKQAADVPQAGLLQVRKALLQVGQLSLVPLASKKALMAFLQQGQPEVEELPDEQLFNSAPEAHGYEFQSGGIVDMLEKLKLEFGRKKYELEREELTAQHAYEQIAQTLADNTENAQHEINKKTELLAELQKNKAEAEGDLRQTTADRAEDEKYLSDTQALCKVKTSDFESRQKLRAEELESIAKAVEILSSNAVSGAGEKHLPSSMLEQKLGDPSLVQTLNDGARSPLQARISAFLADRARSCNSRLLSLMSERVASDPFTKVKKMIKDLIFKLMEEATAETEHKGWCDTELATNKQTRDLKTEQVDKLTGEVEDLTSLIAQLTQEVADLSSDVKELTAAMAQASADREASSQRNDQTIKEAKEAQASLTQAMAILKDFYAKSADATVLAQQSPAEDAPETFSSPYKGLLPEGNNVVGFLEVILADFARLESETSTSEATEVDEYKKYMFESEKDKALKENEISHKDTRRMEKENDLHSANEELKATQDQLDKAVAYYEKLKPTCVDSGITYEERVKRREEEIQSLQEALKILAGTDVDLGA